MASVQIVGWVHRVGGGEASNLGLKPPEARLDPPGISVLIGGTPAETAAAFRRVFGRSPTWGGLQAPSVRQRSSKSQRSASMSSRFRPATFPTHGRIIHPTGVGGVHPGEPGEALTGLHRHDGAVIMTEPRKVDLIGPDDSTLAELLIADEEEGSFTGQVVGRASPSDVEKVLAWYDEVMQDQMLSYLDEAVAAVQRLELRARFPDGSMQKTSPCTSAHRTKSRSGSSLSSRRPGRPRR